MTKKNQTKNPFTALGTPNMVVVNGVQENNEDIVECLQALHNHFNEVIAFRITRIDGFVKLCVATV